MRVVYLMGAGRSGTTLLATLLGNSEHIVTLGEMHQFLDYMLDSNPCSCGQQLSDCVFWKPVLARLQTSYSAEELQAINKANKKVEKHRNILGSLMFSNRKYQAFQQQLFKHIQEAHSSPFYLDSAKYISRGAQLAKTPGIDIKIVYMVRDVRGLIHSFGKNVQTSKSPISTLFYYTMINSFGLIAQGVMGKKKVLRLRYESLVENPQGSLQKMGAFFGTNLDHVHSKLKEGQPFDMPHIIAGNRMKTQKTIRLKPDFAWKKSQSRPTQILYYLLTLPLQLIFKYRI
ncbi:MAG: sulfotransferase [Gilvibacter sp.]